MPTYFSFRPIKNGQFHYFYKQNIIFFNLYNVTFLARQREQYLLFGHSVSSLVYASFFCTLLSKVSKFQSQNPYIYTHTHTQLDIVPIVFFSLLSPLTKKPKKGTFLRKVRRKWRTLQSHGKQSMQSHQDHHVKLARIPLRRRLLGLGRWSRPLSSTVSCLYILSHFLLELI